MFLSNESEVLMKMLTRTGIPFSVEPQTATDGHIVSVLPRNPDGVDLEVLFEFNGEGELQDFRTDESE